MDSEEINMATMRVTSETGDVLGIEGKSGKGFWGILLSILLVPILLAVLIFWLALVALPFRDQLHLENIGHFIIGYIFFALLGLSLILTMCGVIYLILPKTTTITLDKRRGEIEIKRKMIVSRTRHIPLSPSELIGVCFLRIDVEKLGRFVGKIKRILSELLRPFWQTREKKGVKGRDLAMLRKARDGYEAVSVYRVVGYTTSEVREAARKMAAFLETKFIETPVISATQAYGFFTGARSSRAHKVEDFSRP
jgi:hypothetical protein